MWARRHPLGRRKESAPHHHQDGHRQASGGPDSSHEDGSPVVGHLSGHGDQHQPERQLEMSVVPHYSPGDGRPNVHWHLLPRKPSTSGKKPIASNFDLISKTKGNLGLNDHRCIPSVHIIGVLASLQKTAIKVVIGIKCFRHHLKKWCRKLTKISYMPHAVKWSHKKLRTYRYF